MSEAALNLIDAFTALPVTERHAVLLELARISEDDAGDINNDELSFAGEQIFAIYDAEDADSDETNAR